MGQPAKRHAVHALPTDAIAPRQISGRELEQKIATCSDELRSLYAEESPQRLDTAELVHVMKRFLVYN